MKLENLSALTAGTRSIYAEQPSVLQLGMIERLHDKLKGRRQPKNHASSHDDSGGLYAGTRENLLFALAGMTDTETNIILYLHCLDMAARYRLIYDMTDRLVNLHIRNKWETPKKLKGKFIIRLFAMMALEQCNSKMIKSDADRAKIIGVHKSYYSRNLKARYEASYKLVADLVSKAEDKAQVRLRKRA